MISYVFYISVTVVFLLVLLWTFLARRRDPLALRPAVTYERKFDLRPFLKTRSDDLEFIPVLFRAADLNYLREFPYARAETRRFKHGRQQLALKFLFRLRGDFQEILFVHRHLARQAEQLSARYEGVMLRERLRFWVYFLKARLALALQFNTPKPSPNGIVFLARMVEVWKNAAEERLSWLTPEQMAQLAADLQLRSLQARIS